VEITTVQLFEHAWLRIYCVALHTDANGGRQKFCSLAAARGRRRSRRKAGAAKHFCYRCLFLLCGRHFLYHNYCPLLLRRALQRRIQDIHTHISLAAKTKTLSLPGVFLQLFCALPPLQRICAELP
jgi:hypothetical protein